MHKRTGTYRVTRECPEDCRYRAREVPFCGFCMMEILGKKEKEKEMQMMIDNPEGKQEKKDESKVFVISDNDQFKKLVSIVPDEVIVIIYIHKKARPADLNCRGPRATSYIRRLDPLLDLAEGPEPYLIYRAC